MTLIGYFGHYRSTELPLDLLNPGEAFLIGAGQISCPECEGTGDWSEYLPEPPDQSVPCVVCKGTGKVYISV